MLGVVINLFFSFFKTFQNVYINYTSDVIRKNECGIASYEKHAFATSLILHIGSEIGALGKKYHTSNTVLSLVQSCVCKIVTVIPI